MATAVTHFEIYGEEPAKLAEFYRNLFGWQIEQAPGIDYWRIQTGAADPENINGGLTYRPIPGPRSWVHYVNVASLDDAVAEVQRLGGTVLRPKTAVPKTAWYRRRGMRSWPTRKATSLPSGRPTRRHFHRPNRTDIRQPSTSRGIQPLSVWALQSVPTNFVPHERKTRCTTPTTRCTPRTCSR